MSIQQIPQQPNRNNVAFKGMYESTMSGLRFLVTNPTMGAVGIDVGTMGIPRPTVEFKNRGFDAGLEAAIRENSSAMNNAFIGLYGVSAAYMLSGSFNKKYGVRGDKILTNNDSVDIFSKIFLHKQNIEAYKSTDYAFDVLSKLEGFNHERDNNGWTKLNQESKQTLKSFIDGMTNHKSSNYKIDEKDFNKIKALIVSDTGAEGLYRLSYEGKTAENSLDNFINDAFSMSKTFADEHLLKKLKIEHGDVRVGFENFVGELKKLKFRSGVLGLALPAMVGASLMPAIAWFTKHRTGKDGFVGVEDKSKDNSGGFLGMKLAAAAGILGFSWLTIGKSAKEIGKKLQFTGKLPNISQFKFIYGVVIASRFLASRDKNELRETAIKDPLGYINWLILGGVVSKITANALDKNLINYNEKGKGFWNWVTKANVKSYDEVMMPALKGKLFDGKGKLLSFKEMLNILPKETKLKVKNIAIAQVAGYLYSAIALGWGITKLNIYLTKKFNDNEKAQSQKM